jgi:hypothetical protein
MEEEFVNIHGVKIPLKDMNPSAQLSIKGLHPEMLLTQTPINHTFENKIINEDTLKLAREKLRECYYDIIDVLKEYCDIPENYYEIVTFWIMGTYHHDKFETFPLLFINAAKGSGKSRLLRLIANLTHNGQSVIDLREAALFRTAKNCSLCIDEFEGIGKKENSTLRTLLNACYKKGNSVKRMKKVKIQNSEEQIVETFDLYCPIAIANIWGMEQVLADRCLTIILEKSNNQYITKLIEDFEHNPKILEIKRTLNTISVYDVYSLQGVYSLWNCYLRDYYTTLHTHYTLPTLPTLPTPNYEKYLYFFNKIRELGLSGRNLELFFPLFFIANIIGEKELNGLLKIAKQETDEKDNEEYAENKDVALIDFISHKEEYRNKFIFIYDITKEFKYVTSEDPDEEKWLNPIWLGRALKRNKLIVQKRRIRKGIEVILDIDKAKMLLSRFKEVIKC